MYNFILNCWQMGKIAAADVEAFAAKGFITEKEAQKIASEPQQA
ncbi:hypothetical protein [Fumia xinanensis]|nr:hypothetical protein [Fumia xinanensis]